MYRVLSLLTLLVILSCKTNYESNTSLKVTGGEQVTAKDPISKSVVHLFLNGRPDL